MCNPASRLSHNSWPLELDVSAESKQALASRYFALLFAAAVAVCATAQAHPHGEETIESYYEDANGNVEATRSNRSERPRYDDSEPSEAFVRHALAMMGHPYRYGGEQPGGFDCSGLVQYAALQVGTRLPRTSRELLHVGRQVDRSKLRPGDLLFFHGSGRKPLHVGIYIGDDYFVHAPSSGRVVSIDDLHGAYYQRNYWQARRVQFEGEREYFTMSSGHRDRAAELPND